MSPIGQLSAGWLPICLNRYEALRTVLRTANMLSILVPGQGRPCKPIQFYTSMASLSINLIRYSVRSRKPKFVNLVDSFISNRFSF